MTRSVRQEIWAFDCEWVPDLLAGRLLYRLPDDLPDHEVLRIMWEQGGATADHPEPFLRVLLCRVVSIATVIRRVTPEGRVQLLLHALPENPDDPTQDERHILKRFLQDGLARHRPQLVGFNSRHADLRILTQRAITAGISVPSLAERLAAKPWESLDVDLMEQVAGFGKQGNVSLHELATLCGIPGKLTGSGEKVCGLWFSGRRREIVNYNCLDALTTYLLWLRLAHFAGQFDDNDYIVEQRRVRDLIEDRVQRPEGAYLSPFLDAWHALKQRTGQANDGVFEADASRA